LFRNFIGNSEDSPYHFGISDQEASPLVTALDEAGLNLPLNIADALKCFEFLVKNFNQNLM
jgi:hypothetical protein